MTLSPAVVLVRPSEEGNVGAAARAMANTGLADLVLVEPAAPLGRTARAFAVHARHILDRVRREPSLAAAVAPYRRVVGTTSGRDRSLDAPVVDPRELAARLAAEPLPTALVFGPETSGLTTDELARCSLLVRIPAAPRQPTLNLAQAVLILGYELFVAGVGAAPAAGPEPPATAAEVDGLFGHLDRVLTAVGFARDDTYDSVVRDLRRLAGRAAPTPREVQILRGICRRTLAALSRRTR